MGRRQGLTEVSSIAIDGPAASGKSTLAKRMARHLGYLYFDTGVMYRAVTYAALQQDVPIGDEDAISRLAGGLDIDVQPNGGEGQPFRVLLDGENITGHIRSADIDRHVSEVSTYPGVRQAMTARQRQIAQRGRVVMVGRDIGTVVLPDADLKIYLDASVEARARRRFGEIRAQGGKQDYESVLESMRQRDRLDSSRALAPLKPAEDAVILDTTRLSIDEVFEEALSLVAQAASKGDPDSPQRGTT